MISVREAMKKDVESKEIMLPLNCHKHIVVLSQLPPEKKIQLTNRHGTAFHFSVGEVGRL